MKRKETLLESKLIEKKFRLVSKQYIGKHSDKVDSYVYEKIREDVSYCVVLNKTRTKIKNYYFTTNRTYRYTNEFIDSLKNVIKFLEEELEEIYDFDLGKVKEEQIVIDETISEDNVTFIEESHFDD